MVSQERASLMDRLKAFLEPWNESIADPQRAQEAVLHRYLQIYAQTEYGSTARPRWAAWRTIAGHSPLRPTTPTTSPS